MFVPSKFEAFGQTASEAQSCGTPVVCFDSTGLKDVVLHKVSGYKARPFDIDDFVYGIDWVLNKGSEIREAASKHAHSSFGIASVAERYVSLYAELLNR